MPNYRTIIAFKGPESSLIPLYTDLLKAERSFREGRNGWIGRLLRLHNCRLADHVPQNYCLQDVWLDKNTGFPCLKLLLLDSPAPMLSVFNKYAKLYGLSYVYLAEDYRNGSFFNSDTEGTIFGWRCFFTVIPCSFAIRDGSNDAVLEDKLRKLCYSPFHATYQSLFDELNTVGANVNSLEEMHRFLDLLKMRYPEEEFLFREYADKI